MAKQKLCQKNALLLIIPWLAANGIFLAGLTIAPHFARYRTRAAVNRLTFPFRAKTHFIPAPCRGPDWPESTMKYGLPYQIYSPSDHGPANLIPLVVVLHGAGERSDDFVSTPNSLGRFLVHPDVQERYRCVVVQPRCPTRMTWNDPVDCGVGTAVSLLIEETCQQYGIDRNRIYFAGHSMGARGCFEIAREMPGRVAGILAVAGCPDDFDGQRDILTPVWLVTGALDPIAKPQEMQKWFDQINESKGMAHLTILAGMDHNSWEAIEDNPEPFLDWLFQQSLSLSPSAQETTSSD